ncbi:tRNA (adenosine(37)-N6)-dimethylallyltransferase MiaA [soil metagenome]
MSEVRPLSRLTFVVGPTASGKTALAIDIAQKTNAEIISADSVQFFEELKIGSARPTDQELALVKHHFVGHVSVAQDYTAGDFARDAMDLIQKNPSQNYVVVGGSGFYIQALEKGMYPTDRSSEAAQDRIEARVDELGLEAVYRELQKRDALTAAKIAVQDRYRIVRALEILETLPAEQTLSGVKSMFETQAKLRFPGRTVQTIGLRIERARLEPRVKMRTIQMLKAGFVDEVTDLVKRGYDARPALQSVGYKEVLQYLKGEIPESDLAPLIVRGTLRLAKKQRTWFNRAPETAWFDAESERGEAVRLTDA